MSGDQLAVRSPGDRAIAEYLCDHALLGDRAMQLQQTGEETQELHRFVTAIIANDVEVQDGLSIEALRDMALTVGDGLGQLGDYFVKLGTAAWSYADACRIAGDRTKHMFERRNNLEASLATLVDEREQAEGWLTDARSLPEDGTANGYLIRYTVLNEECLLNPDPSATVLDGMPKEQAVRTIESHLEALQTLQDSVHRRNDEMLIGFDSAVEEWEGEGEAFVRSLQGILGVLADTRAENNYQRVGDIGEVASWAGTGFDVILLIPGGQAVGVAGGKVVDIVEGGAAGAQVLMVGSGSRDGTIRTAQGQFSEEVLAAGESGLGAPTDHMLKKAGLRAAWRELTTAVNGVATKGVTAVGATIDPGRAPELPEDIPIGTDPIASWQQAADESNPDIAYVPNQPMPTSDERAQSVPGAPVQIPVAGGSDESPTPIPESPAPESSMTVTTQSGDRSAEPESEPGMSVTPASGSGSARPRSTDSDTDD